LVAEALADIAPVARITRGMSSGIDASAPVAASHFFFLIPPFIMT